MFTGIILGKGKIFEKRPAGGGMIFGLEAVFELADPREGESIAINGVCLTAKNMSGRRFFADVSPETLARTNLGLCSVGDTVNLERALLPTDRLGGHLVSGHVDATTRLIERKPLGDFVLFTFAVPDGLGRYIIEKGSIAVDGISLTVNQCDEKSFSVSIIPHTLDVTILGGLKQGGVVNIEVDQIGKYVEKLLSIRSNGRDSKNTGINPAFLTSHGFMQK